MKYIVIIPDGAADYPLDALEGKTPLEVADMRFTKALARNGTIGRVRTIPKGYKPSSDVANLALLGYEPQEYYRGRGPLEAANLGIDLQESDIAFRCNLITEAGGKLLDYSAGHIGDKEAKILMEFLNKEMGSEGIEFYHGISYRNLMVYRNSTRLGLDKLEYHAPHDIMGKEIVRHLPYGNNSELVIRFMEKSQKLLAEHEINHVRIDLRENPANMIWLWGCGHKPAMPDFEDKFGLKGAVISAVDLIKGIGKLVNLKVLEVPGATGYYDTNYLGKAQAALDALEEVDYVFIHIEATDEAGHNGDLRMKIACLERIDRMIVGTIVQKIKTDDYRILITPDHPTPIIKRTHTDEPVPFMISGKGVAASGCLGFNEAEAAASNLYFDSASKLINFFLKGG